MRRISRLCVLLLSASIPEHVLDLHPAGLVPAVLNFAPGQLLQVRQLPCLFLWVELLQVRRSCCLLAPNLRLNGAVLEHHQGNLWL